MIAFVMENGGSTPFSTTSVQDSAERLRTPRVVPRLMPPLTTETGTQAVENGVKPPYSTAVSLFVEYGGSTPFSTTSVQDSAGRLRTPRVVPRLMPPLTTETGTQAVENGVKPPYSTAVSLLWRTAARRRSRPPQFRT